jgi:hypothetical protein
MKTLHTFDELTRRDFVSNLAKTLLGNAFLSSLPELRAANAPSKNAKAQSVIYLYMEGGMSHLDTFDPKPDNKEIQGSTGVIDTSVAGVKLADNLPQLAAVMKSLAIIRSMTSKEGAHERAKYLLHTSYPPLSSVAHPTLGSWVMKEAGRMNESLPGYLAIGNHPFNSGFFDNDFDPFHIGDPEHALLNVVPPKDVNEETTSKRLELMKQLGKKFNERYQKVESVTDYANFYDRAVALMKSKDLDAFDLTQEKEAVREKYGKNAFGQGVLLARRLVEIKARYVEVTLTGWDTHIENFEKVPDLASQLDNAAATLITDLASRGMLESTLVVIASEFGRTPKINDAKGRDHHPSVFSCVLAGGGVRGGQVYGSSDSEGRAVADSGVTMMDVNASIAFALGLDPATETISPVGRPFTLSGGGKPISRLFS